jgi:hypothetical protein
MFRGVPTKGRGQVGLKSLKAETFDSLIKR